MMDMDEMILNDIYWN